MNVLFVDDDTFVIELIKMLTDGEDFQLFTADNGQNAWEIFQQETIDLVVTDIKMPDMDGLELLTKIKSIKPQTPVIALTGQEIEKQELEAHKPELWFSQVIVKPLHDFVGLVQSYQ